MTAVTELHVIKWNQKKYNFYHKTFSVNSSFYKNPSIEVDKKFMINLKVFRIFNCFGEKWDMVMVKPPVGNFPDTMEGKQTHF